MSKGSLVLHRGAREVDRGYLATVPTPAPDKRWVPIPHAAFVDAVHQSLEAQGFQIERERYAVSRDDARMFAVLDLRVDVTAEVSLAVGIRSSLDQSYPLGFCAGQRVFVCDNLSFSAELMAKRKHTARGLERFGSDIAACVSRLPEFVHAEQRRIQRLRQWSITSRDAESLILRAMADQKIISHRQLPAVLDEWREPHHEAFDPRNAWSLFNAFTSALADRAKSNPQAHAHATMRLQGFLAANVGYDSPDLEAPSLIEE